MVLVCYAALSACTQDPRSPLKERINDLLEPYLAGAKIELTALRDQEKVKAPGLFAVESAEDRNCLSIAFPREGFDNRFIQDFFFSRNENRPITPFAAPGIEAILTSDKVVLNLYDGVVLHVQPAMVYQGGYKAFKAQVQVGEVVKIVGHAFRAIPDRPLPSSLSKFVYLRDGRFSPATNDKVETSKQSTALSRIRETFEPRIADKSVAPISIACRAMGNS